MLNTNSVTAVTVDSEPTLSQPFPNIPVKWGYKNLMSTHFQISGLMQHYCMMEQNRITVSSNFTGSMVGNIKSKQYEKHIHLIGHWLIWLDVDQLALQTNTGLNSNQITSKFGKETNIIWCTCQKQIQKTTCENPKGHCLFHLLSPSSNMFLRKCWSQFRQPPSSSPNHTSYDHAKVFPV